MRDYQGDMDYFQDQLKRAGISIEELNMCDYAGCTAEGLQYIVDIAIAKKKLKEKK